MIRKEYYFTDAKVVVEYKNYNSMVKTEEYIFKKCENITDYKDNLENSLLNHFAIHRLEIPKL